MLYEVPEVGHFLFHFNCWLTSAHTISVIYVPCHSTKTHVIYETWSVWVVTWMQFIHTIARAEAVIFAAASLGLSIAKCYYSTCEPCNKSLGLIEIAVGVRSDVWALSAQITLHIGIYYTQKRKKKKILLHSFCNNSQRLVSIDDLAHSMAGRNSAISICIVPTAIIVIRHKSISLWRS